MRFSIALSLVLGWILLIAAPANAQVLGESAVFTDRVIVTLHPASNDAESLAAFIAAFEADPLFDGSELNVLASIPGRSVHLLAASFAPGIEPMDLDLDTRFPAHLENGELLCECDAPEGGTGSTYVDSFDLSPSDFNDQFLRPTLGLDAAHVVTTGGGVTVAVLDTGIDTAHSLFAGRIAPGAWNFVDGNADPRDFGDGLDTDGDGAIDEMTGHGTFVAGLVTIVAPDAMILPIRVLDGDGVGDAWTVAAGIYHAIDAGVDVINLSLRSTLESEIVEDALHAARERGIVAVSAAGNFDREEPKEYPAMEDIVIGVAAVDDLDAKAIFSNFNEDLFISAPGGSVADAQSADLDRSIISAIPGGGYVIWEGTSMATPMVAGAAALLMARHPEWTPDSDTVELVRDLLAASAVDIDPLNPAYSGMLGAGRLDVAAAVALADAMPDADPNDDGGPRDDRPANRVLPRGVTPAELTPFSANGR